MNRYLAIVAASFVAATALTAYTGNDETDVAEASIIRGQRGPTAKVKVDKLTTSDRCEYGTLIPEDELDPGEDNHVLHVWATVSDVQLDPDWDADFAMRPIDILVNGQTRTILSAESMCKTAPDADS